MTAFLTALLNVLLIVSSVLLICLVLIQRGRGGGLAGAFGGMGGSSAFGTKAGDVFTRITIIVAGVWFLLAMGLVILNNRPHASAFQVEGATPGQTSRGTTPEKNLPPIGTPPKSGATDKPKAPDTSGLPPAIPEEPATKPSSKTP